MGFRYVRLLIRPSCVNGYESMVERSISIEDMVILEYKRHLLLGVIKYPHLIFRPDTNFILALRHF